MLKLCSLKVENWLILHPLDGVVARAGGHCPLTEHLPRRLTLRPPWSTVYTYTKLSWEPTARYAPSGGGGGGYEEAPRLHPLLSQIQPPTIPDSSVVPNSIPSSVLDPPAPQAWTHRFHPFPLPVTESKFPGLASPRSQAHPLPGEKLTTEICSLPSVWIATKSWVSVSSNSHL